MNKKPTHTIEWIDRMREPQCETDPLYPHGRDLDVRNPKAMSEPWCLIDLPYPAKRCGVYVIECETCKFRIGVTTAGRPDDPRSIKIPCNRRQ